MAKNVTVQGASYEDVPAVELPQTGGGTALFTDTSDSTLESANELVSGVTAYDRSGNLLTGTADYMDLVSNPTANDVLVTDANGQAQDSGVQLSTLTGKQDALTVGRGISIDASNNISVYYPNLENTDLDTVTYQYYGWVRSTCTNRPTAVGTSGGLFLCDRSSVTYAVQIFIPYNSNTVYERRRNNSSTWGTWTEINSYEAGDVFEVSNNPFVAAGFVLNTGASLRCYIPLPKPINATGTVTINSLTVNVMGATGVLMSGINVLTNANYSATATVETTGKCGVTLVITPTTAFAEGSRGRPVTVQFRPLKLTFS